ncbi:MAG TPA: hypothetical protein VK974_13290 [Methylophilaceae bacterium]|nr:hypothetical protein [Methylophilaceae bacterium]
MPQQWRVALIAALDIYHAASNRMDIGSQPGVKVCELSYTKCNAQD